MKKLVLMFSVMFLLVNSGHSITLDELIAKTKKSNVEFWNVVKGLEIITTSQGRVLSGPESVPSKGIKIFLRKDEIRTDGYSVSAEIPSVVILEKEGKAWEIDYYGIVPRDVAHVDNLVSLFMPMYWYKFIEARPKFKNTAVEEKSYEGKKCYFISLDDLDFYIDKTTSQLIASGEDGGIGSKFEGKIPIVVNGNKTKYYIYAKSTLNVGELGHAVVTIDSAKAKVFPDSLFDPSQVKTLPDPKRVEYLRKMKGYMNKMSEDPMETFQSEEGMEAFNDFNMLFHKTIKEGSLTPGIDLSE